MDSKSNTKLKTHAVEILSSLPFALYLVWGMLYFFIFYRAIKLDETYLQTRIAHFLYDDMSIIIINVIMFLRTMIVTSGKERGLRLTGSALFFLYLWFDYNEYGFVFNPPNFIVMGLLLWSTHYKETFVVYTSLLVQTVIAILRIGLSLLGMGTDDGWIWPVTLVQDYGRADVGVETRYRFGFKHPNEIHVVLFLYLATLLYLFRNNEKARRIVMVAGAVLNVFLYHYSGSRGGSIAIWLLLLFSLLYPIVFRKIPAIAGMLLYGCIQMVPVVCFALTYLIGKEIITAPIIVKTLNKILTGRIVYILEAFHKIPITLLGNTSHGLIIDSKYIYLLFINGIVGFVFYFIVRFLLGHWLFTRKDYAALAIMSAFDLYFLIDGGIFHMECSFILYMLAYMCNAFFKDKTSASRHSR